MVSNIIIVLILLWCNSIALKTILRSALQPSCIRLQSEDNQTSQKNNIFNTKIHCSISVLWINVGFYYISNLSLPQ